MYLLILEFTNPLILTLIGLLIIGISVAFYIKSKKYLAKIIKRSNSTIKNKRLLLALHIGKLIFNKEINSKFEEIYKGINKRENSDQIWKILEKSSNIVKDELNRLLKIISDINELEDNLKNMEMLQNYSACLLGLLGTCIIMVSILMHSDNILLLLMISWIGEAIAIFTALSLTLYIKKFRKIKKIIKFI